MSSRVSAASACARAAVVSELRICSELGPGVTRAFGASVPAVTPPARVPLSADADCDPPAPVGAPPAIAPVETPDSDAPACVFALDPLIAPVMGLDCGVASTRAADSALAPAASGRLLVGAAGSSDRMERSSAGASVAPCCALSTCGRVDVSLLAVVVVRICGFAGGGAAVSCARGTELAAGEPAGAPLTMARGALDGEPRPTSATTVKSARLIANVAAVTRRSNSNGNTSPGLAGRNRSTAPRKTSAATGLRSSVSSSAATTRSCNCSLRSIMAPVANRDGVHTYVAIAAAASANATPIARRVGG